MRIKRWQFVIGALAVFAAAIACTLPAGGSAPIPIPSPTSTPTRAPQEPKPQISRIPSGKTSSATVSALRSLNVRADSNYQSDPIGALYHGEEVDLTNNCTPSGWVEIFYKGSRAWVNGRYLSGDPCREEE